MCLAVFLCFSIGLSSCKTASKTASKTESNPTAEKEPTKAAAAKGALEMKQSAILDNIVYNKEYDAEFQQIFSLANRGKWEDAENLAIDLHNRESA